MHATALRLHSFVRDNSATICFILGFVCVLIPCVLFVSSGSNYVVVPFDQLDSVIERYLLSILHAKDEIAPELMGGTPVVDLSNGTFIPRMLFTFFPAYLAYSLLVSFVLMVSYVGMFLLLHEVNIRALLCMITAIGFAFLPFFGAYGLNAMGLPILAFGFVRVWRQPRPRNYAISLLCLAIYAACSGLSLSGYFVCMVLFVAGLIALTRGKQFRKVGIFFLAAIPTLIVLYAIANPMLIGTLGSANAAESSRSEMVLSAQAVTGAAIWDFFRTGHYHVDANQQYILLLSAASLVVFVCVAVYRKLRKIPNDQHWSSCRKLSKAIICLLVAAFSIACFYVFFHGELAISIRNYLPGSLRTVQFDRFYWAYPAIWHCTFALSGELLLRLVEHGSAKRKKRSRYRALSGVCTCAMWGVVIAIASVTLYGSIKGHTGLEQTQENIVTETVDINYLHPDCNTSSQLTWERFYAEDLFREIKEDIGKPLNSFRVVSVGMYPNIALYNGFYTLDGYQAYYSLSYKHEFREIIADELNLSESLQKYFDEWGGRCYAFSHEIGMQYLIPKNSSILIQDLRFNLDQVKKMGGEYIISAVRIANPEKYGLSELGDYVSDNSYYHLFVYSVN